MTFIPSPQGLSEIFREASAPAFLLAGVAAFVSVLMNRLGATIDRLRKVVQEPVSGADPVRVEREVQHLKRRAVLLHQATLLALLAALATTFLLMVMVVTGYFGLRHAFGAPFLFAAASVLLSLALFRFAQEIRIALGEIDQI